VSHRGWRATGAQVRRALDEFAAVPIWIIFGFLLLAAAGYLLDHTSATLLDPVRQVMRQHVFATARSTGDLLGTIAASLITVTSITFSLLLLAVQQSAASLTTQVLDQYLRRRFNQVVFGFFVGLALYALVILSTVDEPFNPVISATIALILMAVALGLLPVLLYSTLDQMRPAAIVDAIHDHTLLARHQQLALLRKTRRASVSREPAQRLVRTAMDGFVTNLDVDAIGSAAQKARGDLEVTLRVAIGSYVAHQDVVAELKGGTFEDQTTAEQAVLHAITLDRQRDLDTDPAYGIQQLVTIAWTSISTSKQNPAPGVLVVQRLRDLLARWSAGEAQVAAPPSDPVLSVVYDDDVLKQLMDAFEALAIVSTESMQHQVFAEVARSFAVTLDRMPVDLQDRAADVVCRSLTGLGDHILAADLESALAALSHALIAAGRLDAATRVTAAQAQMKDTVGHLHSRSTRVASAP
jgi:uncharacterized membrane protein